MDFFRRAGTSDAFFRLITNRRRALVVTSAIIAAIAFCTLRFPATSQAAETACLDSSVPYGYIGAYWKLTNGSNGPYGCPITAEADYRNPSSGPGSGLQTPGARVEQFEFGTIVWFPNLGSQAIFAAYWIPDGSHVEINWTSMKNAAHWRVETVVGSNQQFIDVAGGTSGREVVGIPKGNVRVRLFACSGATDSDCPQKSSNGAEVASVGLNTPSIDLTADQYVGVVVPPKQAPVTAPKPAPSYLEVKLDTAQLRSMARFNIHSSNSLISSTDAPCAAACAFPEGSWTWESAGYQTTIPPGLSEASGVATYSLPVVGYSYDTHKDSASDGYSNLNYRIAMRFDVSAVAHRNIGAAYLIYHIKRGWDNFTDGGAMCGTQLGTATSDWWDNPHQSLDAADFSTLGKLYPAASGIGPNFDVTSIVKAWAAAPIDELWLRHA